MEPQIDDFHIAFLNDRRDKQPKLLVPPGDGAFCPSPYSPLRGSVVHPISRVSRKYF